MRFRELWVQDLGACLDKTVTAILIHGNNLDLLQRLSLIALPRGGEDLLFWVSGICCHAFISLVAGLVLSWLRDLNLDKVILAVVVCSIHFHVDVLAVLLDLTSTTCDPRHPNPFLPPRFSLLLNGDSSNFVELRLLDILRRALSRQCPSRTVRRADI